MENANFKSSLVSLKSLDQLIKGHELKYIENVIEVEEEAKLIEDNSNDFNELPEEVQKKAVEIYPIAQADPDYFEKPESDKSLIKPLMILSNIDNKKNEVKVKTWKIEYHARVINRLKQFRAVKASHSIDKKLNFFKRLFSK